MDFTPETAVLLSGGVDSAACLRFYMLSERHPVAFFVDLNQPAVNEERKAAIAISKYYDVDLIQYRLMGSSVRTSGEISGRNLFLISVAILESPPSVTAISLGLHKGVSYSDCSEFFLKTASDLSRLVSNDRIQVVAPFMNWTKAEIFEYAVQNNVPIELTYSCEEKGPKACGTCLSCQDRKALNACT